MFPHERPYSYEDLLEIFTQLRSPNGCPWDIEQTHLSLLPYLREESAEVQDAIINGDVENKEVISLKNLASGQYIVEVINVGNSYYQKVIKN